MLYPAFLTALGRLARRSGLSMLLDSNGTVSFRGLPQLLEVCSGVMLDIKAVLPADHLSLTGGSSGTVLDNAVFLHEAGRLEEVRAVIAPQWYDVKTNISALGEFLRPLYARRPFRVKLIRFRPQGVRPEYAAGAVPGQELMERLRISLASALETNPDGADLLIV